ncbi:MAG: copper chaperone CopZ [Syntrophomonadaceae bacterium]|nr:copper chaperone CopZ [Syntrophomonadaceae bacterium]
MPNAVTEVLNVEGMSCMHCVNAVKNALSSLTGVGTVDVDLADKKVTVGYDQDQVNLEQIKNSIQDAGYEVK